MEVIYQIRLDICTIDMVVDLIADFLTTPPPLNETFWRDTGDVRLVEHPYETVDMMQRRYITNTERIRSY